MGEMERTTNANRKDQSDMRLTFFRMVAILLLVVPGFAATYGFLEMKNAVFDYMAAHGNEQAAPAFNWLQFLVGLALFAGGVGFIGGWIFYRDRKRNYVAPRFKARKKEHE